MTRHLVLLFTVLVLAPLAASAQTTKPSNCPAASLCESLHQQYLLASKGDKQATKEFLVLFMKLVPKYDCMRSFDTAPVPAIWLCGDDIQFEAYCQFVADSEDRDLKRFFASPEFRSVLDGAVAEFYYKRSEEAEQKLKSPPKPRTK